MQLLHDYLLVKEVVNTGVIEGTSLHIKYDDTERFMTVEIVQVSKDLVKEYLKYYNYEQKPTHISTLLKYEIDRVYKPGNILIINRVAKTPYKDGLFFISFKDVIACENIDDTPVQIDVTQQLLKECDD